MKNSLLTKQVLGIGLLAAAATLMGAPSQCVGYFNQTASGTVYECVDGHVWQATGCTEWCCPNTPGFGQFNAASCAGYPNEFSELLVGGNPVSCPPGEGEYWTDSIDCSQK